MQRTLLASVIVLSLSACDGGILSKDSNSIKIDSPVIGADGGFDSTDASNPQNTGADDHSGTGGSATGSNSDASGTSSDGDHSGNTGGNAGDHTSGTAGGSSSGNAGGSSSGNAAVSYTHLTLPTICSV